VLRVAFVLRSTEVNPAFSDLSGASSPNMTVVLLTSKFGNQLRNKKWKPRIVIKTEQEKKEKQKKAKRTILKNRASLERNFFLYIYTDLKASQGRYIVPMRFQKTRFFFLSLIIIDFYGYPNISHPFENMDPLPIYCSCFRFFQMPQFQLKSPVFELLDLPL
jgi:hypothetical protein